MKIEFDRFRPLELRRARKGVTGVPVPAGMPSLPSVPKVSLAEKKEKAMSSAPRFRGFGRLAGTY